MKLSSIGLCALIFSVLTACSESEPPRQGQAGNWTIEIESEDESSAPGICEPGEKFCDSNNEAHQCLSDGSAWDISECDSAETCINGVCLPPQCFPGVMFLVDRSTSMSSQWDDVNRSISAVTEQHPNIRFGLSVFPSDASFIGGCSTGDNWPNVPIQAEPAPAFTNFFNNNEVSGATPLENALRWVSENTSTIWNNDPIGSLIILSDGADTCSCGHPNDDRNGSYAQCLIPDLIESTEALVNLGIEVFVIGYNYGDDPAQLDAIAANGGTDYAEHIPAGSEVTLTSSFDTIISNLKDCL